MVDHCLRLLRVVISDENTCYYDVAVIEGNRVLGWACVTRRRAGATTIDNLQIIFSCPGGQRSSPHQSL